LTEILRMGLNQEGGRVEYSIRLLQRFGTLDPYLTPQKIQEIWIEFAKHDVLFSDYTAGEVEPFLDMLFNPRGVMAEVLRLEDNLPVGLAMLTRVIPRFDAMGHFTWWDSTARGKEPLFWAVMKMWFDEFNLRRMSAETPGFGKGLIRMIERLGFIHEGTRREGTIHKESWIGLEMYGILSSELDQKLEGA